VIFHIDPKSIPLPISDQEFEILCLQVCRAKYGTEYYRYAREGQKQHGIDIFSGGTEERYVQCKLYKKDISNSRIISILKLELNKAIKHFKDLKYFVFAISFETRPSIQDECKKLSKQFNITVTTWFWNQIQEEIALSKKLLKQYVDFNKGATIVNDEYISFKKSLFKNNHKNLLEYYTNSNEFNWIGIIHNWDAPRTLQSEIIEAVNNSFETSNYLIASIIIGQGGAGKSVLLRRIAYELRNKYRIYWIDDNGSDFLENEFKHDLEFNKTQKVLVIIEDWYRNITRPNDLISSNRIFQSLKKNKNIKLLIGDRPESQNTIRERVFKTFRLEGKDNKKILDYVSQLVPEWHEIINELDPILFHKMGLFQLLFICQHFHIKDISDTSINYFFDIIQSDYNALKRSSISFYQGMAQALYLYANIYTDHSIRLTEEALIKISEYYSNSQRPIEFEYEIKNLSSILLLSKYLNNVNRYGVDCCEFLHDTIADEGWRNISVEDHLKYDCPDTLLILFEILKSSKTIESSFSIFKCLINKTIIEKHKALKICQFFIENSFRNSIFARIIFTNQYFEFEKDQTLHFIRSFYESEIDDNGTWIYILDWMKNKLKEDQYHSLLSSIRKNVNSIEIVDKYFFRSIYSKNELHTISESDVANSILKYNDHMIFSELTRELGEDDKRVINASKQYLKTDQPYKKHEIFIKTLKILKDNDIAKKAAIKYLNNSDYLLSPSITTVCFKILDYLALDYIKNILTLCDTKINNLIIYRSILISNKHSSNLDLIEEYVDKIFSLVKEKRSSKREYHLYLQILKIPLFRIKSWAKKTEEIISNYKFINRNVAFSITHSYVDEPDEIYKMCIFYIRNWKHEFSRPKKYWGYFVRSLAHPKITINDGLLAEVKSLSSDMINSNICPNEVKLWVRGISEKNEFPIWEIDKDKR